MDIVIPGGVGEPSGPAPHLSFRIQPRGSNFLCVDTFQLVSDRPARTREESSASCV